MIVHEEEDSIELPSELSSAHVTSNLRTRSLSGAINHAIDEILVNRIDWGVNSSETWLALLDDDDWWEDSYLQMCENRGVNGMHQVVCGITRYDTANPEGTRLKIPTTLGVNSFLASNPHIQGSNLFVRLDAFLEAGGFDEALYSCTDRDFCIRLFERPGHLWARLNEHLVHHDARFSGRISDPGSTRKLQGLRNFSVKHQFRMDDSTWESFHEIAAERFDYNREIGTAISDETDEAHRNDSLESDRLSNLVFEEFELTIAVTIGEQGLVEGLLESIKEIVSSWNGHIRVVVCLHRISIIEIGQMKKQLMEEGVEVIIHEDSFGWELAELGQLGPWFELEENRQGASWGRCVLHRATLDAVLSDRRPAIWIVDDDMSLDKGEWRDGDRSVLGSDSLIEAVSFMHNNGIDVGIGNVVGDPPLPSMFTQRTQLLDMHYGYMLRDFPERDRMGIIEINPNEIHHDLASNRWDHLEFPQLGQAELISKEDIKAVFSGKSVTREVHAGWPSRDFEDLIFRGGNTLILDPNVLNEWPNVAPNCGGIQFRRGDSIWALWTQRIRGLNVGTENRRVGWIPFAVPQSRIETPRTAPTIEHVRGDILGGMFLRELDSIFNINEMKNNRSIIGKDDWFIGVQDRTLLASKRREARLISNIFRANQLSRLLGYPANQEETIENLWDSTFPETVSRDLESFCRSFAIDLVKFRSKQPKFIPGHRIGSAWKVFLQYGGTENATVVGQGSEGVVFKEGGRAIKILHEGLSLDKESLDILDGLTFEGARLISLPTNLKIEYLCNRTIVSYDWIDGEHPKNQTPSRPWLDLLREFRENDIVSWDLKPENIVLTTDGKLVMIDLGGNLKRFSEKDWLSMTRKAFLCWRWWFRSDLRSLLTLSIHLDTPEKIPELTDIDYFVQAIEIHDKAELHDPWFIEIMRANPPEKLLDWGCGKGTLSKQIANLGFDVDAWDPITDYADRVEFQSQVKWIDGINEVKEGYYDTAIATLVLWVIEDEDEVVDVLRKMRGVITESGKVIATVCHPLQMCTQCSTSVERPTQQMELGHLTFEKRIRSTNRIRVEHVRSLERLEMLATRANLRISRLIESPGVDINRCAPMPEYLAIEFKPIPKPKHTDVELLILACSMDHSIIEKQVKHIVKQLGGRERFERVTIVTDDSVTGFVRPWDEPDMDEFKAGLDRLIQEEIISQVLWAPKNEDDLQQLNERWYGLSVPIDMAVNGQPVHTSLWGLEQSLSTYVMQIDVDVMIHRDWSIDPTDLLIDCLIEKEALTATLPILSESNSPPRILDGIDWRTEVRFCIFDHNKIMRLRPMENSIEDGKWQLPWHKSMDARIAQTGDGSLRLIDGLNWFVHPQNKDKVSSLNLHRVRRRIERGEISELQKDHVEMVSWKDSHGIRNEEIVVIVRGRNTPYSFIRRHIDSMQSQTDQEFGIIWIDAASDDDSNPHFEYILDSEFPNRVTFIWNELPRSRCENIIFATKYIVNPEAILILLDADDAFAGPEIISHVRDVFDDRVEVAVGGMLRLDKQKHYPADFVNPRINRGGNVWQHLKCFRKRCIDIVPVEMFRMDEEFIHDEDDWALMLPIVEVSNHHHQFTRPMMIYTISENKLLRSHEERDERIARIVSKPSLLGLHNDTESSLDSYLEILKKSREGNGIMLLRHSIRPSFKGMPEVGRDDVSLTDEGREMAINAGCLIGDIGAVLSSPVLRCMQTAEHILPMATIRPSKSLCGGPFGEEWVNLKEELGWLDAIRKWLDGDFRGSQSVKDVGRDIVQYLIESHKMGRNTLAISHDVAILAVAEYLGMRRGAISVPELGGIFIRENSILH